MQLWKQMLIIPFKRMEEKGSIVPVQRKGWGAQICADWASVEKCGSQGQRKEERRQVEVVAWAGRGRYISAGLTLEHFAAIINRARQ